MCLSTAAAVSERVGHQVIVFGAAAVFGVALLAWSSVAIACMGIASPSATLTGRFSRMPPAKNQSSAQEKDAPIRHGFGRFWRSSQQTGQAETRGYQTAGNTGIA